jgi:hypothetical protein
MDISLQRAVADARLALIMDDKERVPLSRTNKALIGLLAAVEALHADGRPKGTVYVVMGGRVTADDIDYIDTFSKPPAAVGDNELAYRMGIGTLDATRVIGTKR